MLLEHMDVYSWLLTFAVMIKVLLALSLSFIHLCMLDNDFVTPAHLIWRDSQPIDLIGRVFSVDHHVASRTSTVRIPENF